LIGDGLVLQMGVTRTSSVIMRSTLVNFLSLSLVGLLAVHGGYFQSLVGLFF
jgi:hypothetical protein